jgi:hypothetical protein
MKTQEHVHLKVNRDGTNTRIGDRNQCSYCHKRISKLYRFLNNGWILVRTNRIDTGGGKKQVHSYHLACYDKLVFGAVRHNTITKVRYIYMHAVVAKSYADLFRVIDFFKT